MRNFIVCNPHLIIRITKLSRMICTGHVRMDGMTNGYKILVIKIKGNRELCGCRRKWEDRITINPKERRSEGVD
jgi:hypothetical protein